MQGAIQAAGAGYFSLEDLLEAHPNLWTLGAPQREGSIRKAVHQPDLALHLDAGRTGSKSKNVLVEVELSKKSWAEYESILATLKGEFEHGLVYEQAVYFTIGSQVETLLKKVDHASGYGLFAAGKLRVLPLTHRDGTPFQEKRRIRIG